MTALEQSESPPPRRLGRRQLMLGGLLGAAGLFAGSAKNAAAVDVTDWLTFESSGPDGASVSYPPTWTLDPSTSLNSSLDPALLYPRQSFGLRTTSDKPAADTSED